MAAKAAENELNRREFMRLTLMSSALLMGSKSSLGEPDAESPSLPYYGALRALPPGEVRPDGWLRTFLEKQAAQLGSQLPEVSWPFTKSYWAEEQEGDFWMNEQQYEAWWPWEQRAYWIDGATRLALLLDDKALLAKATKPITYTLSHPDMEGYLGPELFQNPLGDYHRWPHNVFFRSVAAASDGRAPLGGLRQRDVALVLQRHYLNDQASYGKPKRNVNNIEDMLWCYQQTGEPRLLTMAEKAWKEYMELAADPENADLSAMRVFGNTPINAHGETYAEIAKQPAILYMYTGKIDYLKFAVAAQRRIFDHHMLIDGIPSTSEWFGPTTALDSHETCDISDHTWSWGYLMMATGESSWADRIERACFNAAPGAIKKDWKALQYFSCPNQFIATLDSDHNWPKFEEHGGRMMAFQPNPGQRTACCGGNVHRIFPNYVIRMWMKSEHDGLAAVLYGPSTLKTTVGAEKQPIEIVETTRYPFEEEIRFEINCSQTVTFPLSLRIPGWCQSPRILLNGSAVAAPRVQRGFVVLDREFHPGDTITLTLPMKVALSHWPQQAMGIERGPLVYALPIKAKWSSKVEPKYTTEEFPSWEATPESAWNYGLALDEAKLASEIEVKRTAVPLAQQQDPWEHPPISLSVPARKIEDWELQSNPDKPAQKFTPCLPDLQSSKISETLERISLEPYGSTHLRITVFPRVRS